MAASAKPFPGLRESGERDGGMVAVLGTLPLDTSAFDHSLTISLPCFRLLAQENPESE
jgi:hypothetical protein